MPKASKRLPIPKQIRIAGINFTVELNSPALALDSANLGYFDRDGAVITIDATAADYRQRKVLLHELLHGVDDLFGSGNLTEEQVVTLENGLWAIFNDNPGLASVIFLDNA